MLSEKDILKACQKNPSEGQRLLYTKYAPLLKGISLRYVKDRDEAADVLQDAFVKIFKKLGSFQNEGSLEGWLKRIVVNTALDHLQRKKTKAEVAFSQDEAQHEQASSSDQDEENIVSMMMDCGFNKKMLIDMLHALPQNYATVFNMFFIDEIPHKEIAELLKTTESNSRKLAFRAKEQVKTLLLNHIKCSKEAIYGR